MQLDKTRFEYSPSAGGFVGLCRVRVVQDNYTPFFVEWVDVDTMRVNRIKAKTYWIAVAWAKSMSKTIGKMGGYPVPMKQKGLQMRRENLTHDIIKGQWMDGVCVMGCCLIIDRRALGMVGPRFLILYMVKPKKAAALEFHTTGRASLNVSRLSIEYRTIVSKEAADMWVDMFHNGEIGSVTKAINALETAHCAAKS